MERCTAPVEEGGHYRPDIDGLRAVAVLAVVGFHAAPSLVPGGFAGVDVFFVISGFLISGIILRGLARQRFSLLEFYIRRVRRIFPALVLVLLATWGLGWLILLPDEYRRLGMHIAAGAGFVSNLVLYNSANAYFGPTTTPAALGHLWSLGVEEQFYLVWPLFLAAFWKLGKRSLVPIAISAAASFSLNVAAISRDALASFYLPSSRLWELAMGSALAHAQLTHAAWSVPPWEKLDSQALRWFRPYACHVLGALGAVLLGIAFAALNSEDAFPGWWALAPAVGALLLVAAGPASFTSRVLARPACVLIGLISYPLYLWHWPLLTFTHLVTWGRFTPAVILGVVVISFVLAYLTYRYLERPIRLAPQRGAMALALCASMLLCGCVGYLNSIRRLPARPSDPGLARLLRAAAERYPPESISDWIHLDRYLRLGQGPRHALFIGDSNVFQYYSRVEQFLAEHPANTRGAIFAVRAACALGASELARNPNILHPAQCRAYMQSAVEYALRPDVDTVIIGASWYLYFASWPDLEHYGEPAPLRPDTDRALESVKSALLELVKANKRVYLVLQIPMGAALDPRLMIRRTVLAPGFTATVRSPTRDEIMTAVGPIDTKLRTMAREVGASVIDPLEWLCDKTYCPAVSPDGSPMYHNYNHLLPSYVRNHVGYLDKTLLDPAPESTLQGPGEVAPLADLISISK